MYHLYDKRTFLNFVLSFLQYSYYISVLWSKQCLRSSLIASDFVLFIYVRDFCFVYFYKKDFHLYLYILFCPQ